MTKFLALYENLMGAEKSSPKAVDLIYHSNYNGWSITNGSDEELNSKLEDVLTNYTHKNDGYVSLEEISKIVKDFYKSASVKIKLEIDDISS